MLGSVYLLGVPSRVYSVYRIAWFPGYVGGRKEDGSREDVVVESQPENDATLPPSSDRLTCPFMGPRPSGR